MKRLLSILIAFLLITASSASAAEPVAAYLYGDNGTRDRQVTIDASTRALNTLDYEHHEIHSGSSYTTQYSITTAATDGHRSGIYIYTPASKEIHLIAEFSASSAADYIICEASTIAADTGTDGVVVAAGSKTGYSLTATTGLGNQTANITGNLSGSVGSVTGAVGSVTGAVGSVTGAVGSVAGAVGSVTGAVGSVAGNVDGNVTGTVAGVTPAAVSDLGTVQTGDNFAIVNGAAGLVAIDTVVDAIKVVTDALGSAGAANLALSAAGIIGGTVGATDLATTTCSSDLTAYAADELIGRTIIFTGGTALGQASDITDYVVLNGVITFTAKPTAPVAGDTFVIV